jgi:beta-ureidopropionase
MQCRPPSRCRTKAGNDREACGPDSQAASEGAQIVCLQEIFNGPYFCAEQSVKWYEMTEPVPDGPTVSLMRALAKELHIAMIVPVYEVEQEGIFYNTAAVIAKRRGYLGKYRKTHIPHVAPGFWEKFYFRPGNLGYPVFDLGFAKIGVYICYDRHFPEGARCLGLNGAEIVFNPSATVAGLSEYLWKLEQPAHAAANGYFIAAINRVGTEAPWNIGEFYGSSYFAIRAGQIIAQASRDKDEVLTADLNLDEIAEVRRPGSSIATAGPICMGRWWLRKRDFSGAVCVDVRMSNIRIVS